VAETVEKVVVVEVEEVEEVEEVRVEESLIVEEKLEEVCRRPVEESNVTAVVKFYCPGFNGYFAC
jgi:hypothetical protein